MEFFEVLHSRRSIRKYENRMVEDDKLLKILDAVRLAPSARNRQPWHFIIITDPQVKRQVYEATKDQKSVLEAPVIIAAVGHPSDYVCSNGNIAHLVDLGIAGEHIALSAAALELGTCWIAAFFQDKMREALNVPDDAHIVALFTLGYPAEKPQPKERKPLSQIVHKDRWGAPAPEWAKE